MDIELVLQEKEVLDALLRRYIEHTKKILNWWEHAELQARKCVLIFWLRYDGNGVDFKKLNQQSQLEEKYLIKIYDRQKDYNKKNLL